MGPASISIPADVLDDIIGDTSSSLKISAAALEASVLPQAIRQFIGDNAVYDFNMSVDGEMISEFDGNETSIALDYTLKPGEAPHMVVVYDIDMDYSGKLRIVKNGKYNLATGKMEFKATNFGRYAAAYNRVIFNDLAGIPWATECIEALAARGAINGVGDGAFSPDSNITRAEFIKILMQALDLADESAKANLNDVEEGQWYYSSIAAAQSLGITQGKEDGSFGINDHISRQDMAVMVHRASQYVKADLEQSAGAIELKDKADIAPYAVETVQALHKAGIINGAGDDRFAPKGQATRAQAAVIVYRLFHSIK